jgi:hypothetical protein
VDEMGKTEGVYCVSRFEPEQREEEFEQLITC